MNVLTSYYSGLDGQGDIPPWAILTSGLLYTSYHLLDLLDGKHARRTGTSSPLGMLVDHGCDALTTILLSLSMGSILKLKGPYWFSIMWLLTAITFFFNTLEEYHTGRLDLPIFHGVSEGTLISLLVTVFTAAVGQSFWVMRSTLFGYYQYNELLIAFVFLCSMGYTIVSVIKTIKDPKTKGYLNYLVNCVAFLFLVFVHMVVVFYSNSDLVQNKPKVIIYMSGFAFAKLVGILQLSHITASTFNQFTCALLLFLFPVCSVILFQFNSEIFIKVDSLIIFFTVFNFLSWLHYAYNVSEELCEFLDIYRFTIKKKNMNT